MYIIGIIDDDRNQVKAIRRTIKVNAPKDKQYDFKTYSLHEDSNQLVDSVFLEAMNDIINEKITSLIIDYKIMVTRTKIKGTDIFEKIKEQVPKFPIIILTEVVSESVEPIFIDADKVYKKREFFKIEEEYSKEKVNNIFDSMRKYTEQKDMLQFNISVLKEKMKTSSNYQENIREILKLESLLDDFKPTNQSQIDKIFDEQKAKRIIELIEKANNMLN